MSRNMSRHYSILLDVRFGRLPILWESSETPGRLRFVKIGKPGERRAESIKDPRKLRDHFLRMEQTEENALGFLNRVGAWTAKDNLIATQLPRDKFLDINFDYERFFGVVNDVVLADLWEEQKYWRGLMSPTKQRAILGPSAREKPGVALLTQAFNTLKLHLEIREGRPYGIVQPMTGRELMKAVRWAELQERYQRYRRSN